MKYNFISGIDDKKKSAYYNVNIFNCYDLHGT